VIGPKPSACRHSHKRSTFVTSLNSSNMTQPSIAEAKGAPNTGPWGVALTSDASNRHVEH
jgi:hypothetical protein